MKIKPLPDLMNTHQRSKIPAGKVAHFARNGVPDRSERCPRSLGTVSQIARNGVPDQSEWCPRSIGISVPDQSESVSQINRNQCPRSLGICKACEASSQALLGSAGVSVEPVIVLENITTGSIKTWFKMFWRRKEWKQSEVET